MVDTFESLYAPTLKAVFLQQARQQMAQGVDAIASATSYAEKGKPDFTLAFLLLADCPQNEKCELLAHSYERRAGNSEARARELSSQFHRPFPLIKLEARKDLLAAQAIREGHPLEANAS